MPKNNKGTDVQSRFELILTPALNELGTTQCPICQTEVTVFVTKTNRPFINCSFCSVRIFYNGRESMKRLRKNTKPRVIDDRS